MGRTARCSPTVPSDSIHGSLGNSDSSAGVRPTRSLADDRTPGRLAVEDSLKAFEHLAALGWLHLSDVLKLPLQTWKLFEMIKAETCPVRFPPLHRKQERSLIFIKQ